jgi:hypothetical protein
MYYIVNEECFPLNCGSLPDCPVPWTNPVTDEVMMEYHHQLTSNDEEVIKETLIKYGPISCGIAIDPLNNIYHQSLLVGYFISQPGDTVYYGNGIQDPPIILDEDYNGLGSVTWIFKDNEHNWWPYTQTSNILVSESEFFYGSIDRPNFSTPIICSDEDGDGYYWWGVHRDASGNQLDPYLYCNCPYGVTGDEEDCNDNYKYSGYYDENYNCKENCQYDENPTIISENTIHYWKDQHFMGDLIIPYGKTLIVHGTTLWMGPGTSIIIERGGKLQMVPHLVGGTFYYPRITSGCGVFWKGIEVWGNSNASQASNEEQGILDLNYATIEHMEWGIRNCQPEYGTEHGWAVVPGFTGGIIYADNTTFRDNKTSVVFSPYSMEASISHFTNCTFETNGSLLNNSYSEHFIKMYGIHGISFTDCIFRENGSENMKSCGIYAYNSGFTFNGGNPQPIHIRNNFENMNYGIYDFSNGLNQLYTIDLRDSWFVNNRRGVYLSGINDELIRGNTFIIPSSSCDTCYRYGLYLDHSTSWYQITENYFEKPQSAIPGHVGLYINRCGTDPKEIYKNTFTNLEYATVAYGQNRSEDGEGLVYRCNSFSSNKNDITVLIGETYPEGGGVPSSYDGIAYYQGTPDNPAGNTFTDQNFADYNINNATENGIRYYLPSDWQQYPQYYPYKINDESKIIREPGYIPWSLIDCSTLIIDGENREEILEDMQSFSSEKDSLTIELGLLIDGGSTEELNTEILTSTSQQSLQIYDELILNSPYLSDSVMNSSILKEDVLNNALLRDILVANPQSAKRDSLIDKLDQRLVPMPDTMKAEIMQGLNFLSQKEILESQIEDLNSKERGCFSSLVNSFRKDTLVISLFDSLQNLFTNDDYLTSKYKATQLHISQGDTSNANLILFSIPSMFTFDLVEQNIYQQYLDLFSIMEQLDSLEYNISDINETQQQLLQNLAVGDSFIAGVYARNLLIAADILDYSEPVILPHDSLKSLLITEKSKSKSGIPEYPFIRLFPNPAKNYYVIEYYVPAISQEDDITVNIANIKGQTVSELSFKRHYNQVIQRCDQYPSGPYLLLLRLNSIKVASNIFIISR